MKYAASSTGALMLPQRGMKGVCPDCGDSMTPVCGTVMQQHWRHDNLETCLEGDRESEGEWHREWKSYAPEDRREVTVTKDGRVKRADVKPRVRGSVVELQHSHLPQESVADRDEFYGPGLIWMFDADGRRYEVQRLHGCDFNGYPEYRVRMSDVVGMAFDTTRTATIDLGSDICRLIKYPHDGPGDFHGLIVPAERMQDAIRDSCIEDDPVLADFLKLDHKPVERRKRVRGKWTNFEPAMRCHRGGRSGRVEFVPPAGPNEKMEASYEWRFLNH